MNFKPKLSPRLLAIFSLLVSCLCIISCADDRYKYYDLYESDIGDNPLYLVPFSLVILIFSVIIHEISHGYFAYRAGDSTAKDAGRLSFNPIRHIDPFGSIILPLIFVITKSDFIFGYAKPVPINPWNFRNPRRDDIIVAASGPVSNLCLALIGIFLLTSIQWIFHLVFPYANYTEFYTFGRTLVAGVPFPKLWVILIYLIKNLILLNFVLAWFNLLPIPPLDGSHILLHFLPSHLAYKYYKLFPYGFLIIFALLYLGVFYYLFIPLVFIIKIFFGLASLLAPGL